MRIDGEWLRLADGIARPVIRVQVRAGDGSFLETYFLVDSGADRTVLSGSVVDNLNLPTSPVVERLDGLGGTVASVAVITELRFDQAGAGQVVFRGEYHALLDDRALDLPILGRDVTNRFAVIVDRPGNVVCLLGQRHHYRIEER